MLSKGKGLGHFEVPQAFLKLPVIANISQEPSQSYDLPTRGQIHGQKLQRVLVWLEEKNTQNWKSEIEDIFKGDAIKDELSQLSLSQFLDFLIHLTYANSSIDWNSISLLETYLKKEFNHIPRWTLPKFDFEKDLKSYLSTRISIDWPTDVKAEILELAEIIQEAFSSEEAEFILPASMLRSIRENSPLNLANYFLILGNISVLQQTGLVRYDEFPSLIKHLSQECENHLNTDKLTEITKRIFFIVYYIMIFLRDDPVSIQTCQNLLNRAINDLNHLHVEQKKSYQWLIDAVRVMIINMAGQYKMEMVTEDILLRSIGERFLHPENTDLETWMHAIETTDLPEGIIILLIRGYLSVEVILHRYFSQLPNINNDTLVNLNNFLMSLLKTFDQAYVSGFGFQSEVNLPFYLEYYFIDAWANIGINQIQITPSTQYQVEQLVNERINHSIFAEYYEIYQICSNILTNKYPFAEYLDMIKAEDEYYLHLIGNQAFAELFVDKFAKSFNFAQQSQINGSSIPIHLYKLLIYFQQSWLIHLLTIEDLIQDVILLFLSFLKVTTNMIQSYYNQKGIIKTAKLWDLNYTLFELNLFCLFGYPKVTNINKITSREHIFDDFLRLLSEFDLKQKINTVDIKYLAIDSIFDATSLKFNLHETEDTPRKLQEDNILTYHELHNILDQFLKDLENSSIDQISDLFASCPFKARDPPMTLLDHIARNTVIPGLHYPFVKPLNAFAAAIHFFDLDLEIPKFNKTTSSPPPNNR